MLAVCTYVCIQGSLDHSTNAAPPDGTRLRIKSPAHFLWNFMYRQEMPQKQNMQVCVRTRHTLY
jgi:hypothetical protein